MARPKDKAERARIAAQLQRQDSTKRMLRNGGIALVVLLVVAGAAYGISKIPKEPPFVHYHAKFQVYANGNLESFANPKWDGAVYEAAHMHAPHYDVIHNEAREGQGTMGKFFQFDLGGKLTNDELLVPAGASFPGDYKANATHKVLEFVSNQVTNQSWTKIDNVGDYAFREGDRILVLFGDYTDAQIQDMQARFPDFDPKTVT